MPFATKLKDRLRPVVRHVRASVNTAFQGNCSVLLYHRVIKLETDPQQLSVDPDKFNDHLVVLKENYNVLSVQQFDRYLIDRTKFPENAVLLTFDDGYADNHTYARPLLEKHGMQALFYIASGYIGSQREFWWDELERLLLLNPDLPETLAFGTERIGPFWDIKPSSTELRSIYERSLEELRGLPSIQRDALLDKLRVAMHDRGHRASHLPMTEVELREFATSSSVVIGAHTVGHPSLARLAEDEQRAEITRSKQQLEKLLGAVVPYFSYPFGTGADFDKVTIRVATEAGFDHVAANYPGAVHARSPRSAFPRFLVRNWDTKEFARNMSEFRKQ
ncbi:MAG: polysaccharide deacetylase family protein [Flavobacteriales bacterium]|jgi:peptidoglycan/xylan/chitin deacetylase (PgdA/CDA1 family)|nr:polysaccharide deacetylase family protein [Flavobacteriales bacterium]